MGMLLRRHYENEIEQEVKDSPQSKPIVKSKPEPDKKGKKVKKNE